MRLLNFLLCILEISGFNYNKRIYVTGGTSKLGINVVKKLCDMGYSTRCLVRDKKLAEEIFENIKGIELVSGDILNKELLFDTMKGCDSSINLHGTRRKTNLFKNELDDLSHPFYVNYIGTNNIIESCQKNDIKQLIRLTGLATSFSSYQFWPLLLDTLYSKIVSWHKESEKEIIESGLEYTIIRPGAIRDNIEFPFVEITDNTTKAPGLIGIENLAEVIVHSINPKNSCIIDKSTLGRLKIISCRGLEK